MVYQILLITIMFVNKIFMVMEKKKIQSFLTYEILEYFQPLNFRL